MKEKLIMIKWNATKQESELIRKIADRAVTKGIEVGLDYKKLDAMMDVEACHCNGCKLDLQSLLNADEFNFTHDVFGIRRHLDRRTGELQDCFVPRFAL